MSLFQSASPSRFLILMSRLCLPAIAVLGVVFSSMADGAQNDAPPSHNATPPAQAPDSRTLALQEARAAFDKGDFENAQTIAEELLQQGHLSPQLFELIGHLRYRQGNLGEAALWYQRASLFPPPAPEIRQNIAHIRERTGNVSFPANGLTDQFSAWLTRSQWLTIGNVAAWICLFGLVLYALFGRSSPLRPFLMLVSVLAFCVVFIAGLGWYWHPSFDKVNRLAIVTAPNAKAYTAATVTSGSVMALPPGSQLRRLQERGAWAYVEIPTDGDNKRGWIPSDAMTSFWPFDPAYLE